MRKIFVLFLISTIHLFAQEIKVVQLLNADSLIGSVIENENVRILYGNVALQHEDINITCDKAVQYLQSNKVELDGNIILTQGNVILRTAKGFYFGKTKTAFGTKGIILNDGKVTLKADSGEYFYNEKKAVFTGNVNLFDDTTDLRSNKLTYFTNTEHAIAIGKVIIQQFENKINCDTLNFFRKTNYSISQGNVLAVNEKDNISIYSDYLENDGIKKYSLVKGRPLLIQIDTTEENKIDTLIITAKVMESFRDTAEIYLAYDSVRILRDEFSALTKYSIYDKSNGFIYTSVINDFRPFLWYNEHQAFADSIQIKISNNKIENVKLFNSAFLISQDSLNPSRFNQMNGNFIQLNFLENRLNEVLVIGNSLGIYFLYDENQPNGLNKASSEQAIISFESNKISQIKLIGKPEGEYHPEEKLIDKEKEFLLNGFMWNTNRPKKQELLEVRNLTY